MLKTDALKGPLCREEVIECIVGTRPEDPSWELQAERILGRKTKRNERRVNNEYHKQQRARPKHNR